MKAGAHSTRSDWYPRTTYKEMKWESSDTTRSNDECGPLRDESTSAKEVCARQQPGYEEGNLENSQCFQLDLSSRTFTIPTGDTDDTLFIEKPIVGEKIKAVT